MTVANHQKPEGSDGSTVTPLGEFHRADGSTVDPLEKFQESDGSTVGSLEKFEKSDGSTVTPLEKLEKSDGSTVTQIEIPQMRRFDRARRGYFAPTARAIRRALCAAKCEP